MGSTAGLVVESVRSMTAKVTPLVQKNSRAECADDTSGLPVYYWDSANSVLYIKVVDPERTGANMEPLFDDSYNRGGVRLYYAFGAERFGWKSSRIIISANLGSGSVDNSDSKIPPML